LLVIQSVFLQYFSEKLALRWPKLQTQKIGLFPDYLQQRKYQWTKTEAEVECQLFDPLPARLSSPWEPSQPRGLSWA
jgi:hypothetical protein